MFYLFTSFVWCDWQRAGETTQNYSETEENHQQSRKHNIDVHAEQQAAIQVVMNSTVSVSAAVQF